MKISLMNARPFTLLYFLKCPFQREDGFLRPILEFWPLETLIFGFWLLLYLEMVPILEPLKTHNHIISALIANPIY